MGKRKSKKVEINYLMLMLVGGFLIFFYQFILGIMIHPSYTGDMNNWLKSNHIPDINYYVSGDNVIIENVKGVTGTGSSMEYMFFTDNTLLIRKYNNEFPLKEGQVVITKPIGAYNQQIVHGIVSSYYPNTVLIKSYSFDEPPVYINVSDIEYIVVGVLYT